MSSKQKAEAKEEQQQQPTTLRRSTRSTRGSIKPIVDLKKLDHHSDSDANDETKNKIKENEDDDVQVSDPSDDDFEESGSKSKGSNPSRTQADQRKVIGKKKRQPPKDDKTSKRGANKKKQVEQDDCDSVKFYNTARPKAPATTKMATKAKKSTDKRLEINEEVESVGDDTSISVPPTQKDKL